MISESISYLYETYLKLHDWSVRSAETYDVRPEVISSLINTKQTGNYFNNQLLIKYVRVQFFKSIVQP